MGADLFTFEGLGDQMAKLNHYVPVGAKKMRCGYTTGTCAAAASALALDLLVTGKLKDQVTLITPAGIRVNIEPEDERSGEGWAECAVRKDAGDDPDVTDGVLVYSRVRRIEGKSKIHIDGGEGVGRVTLPGLEQEVGQAAINSVPREMIKEQINEVLKTYGLNWSLDVRISIPQGAEIAKRTFNPRLGIKGGISVLGTSGIVRPMSQQALVDSIALEMDMLHAKGVCDYLITPGNYGDAFSGENLNLSLEKRVNCSNYIGDCIDHAVGLSAKSILVVGHIGKLAKVAGGNMNTHSKISDGRREVLASHTAMCGGDIETVKNVFSSLTTDAAMDFLERAGIRESVMESIGDCLEKVLESRAEGIEVGAIFFSNKYGLLGKTSKAEKLIRLHLKDLKTGEV